VETDLQDLRSRLGQTLAPYVPGPTYALLDFPDHYNPGDSAIWRGEVRVLKELTQRHAAYVASIHDCNVKKLKRLPQEAPIFMHGGGNLGDLWPAHQSFRERICAIASDRRIVVLAQSIQFSTKSALERARVALGAHRDVTLLLRDKHSHAFAQETFDCESVLCPDFALALDLKRPAREPECDLLWLLRKDKESARAAAHPMRAGWRKTDWPASRLLAPPCLRRLGWAPAPAARWAADTLAKARLARGLRVFDGVDAVITDRLHGHVLATLLGIPNVVMPDAHGKIRGLYDTWTHRLPGCAFAESPDEALEKIAHLRSAAGDVRVAPGPH
jgi:pyruvyl transferase EpsO